MCTCIQPTPFSPSFSHCSYSNFIGNMIVITDNKYIDMFTDTKIKRTVQSVEQKL